MATDNPDPNAQAEAFRTPQQVINHTTGETAPDFEVVKSSLDSKETAKSTNRPLQRFPELLYKASSKGKTLSVKVTTQEERDRAISQGWHVGHPVKHEAIVEAEAEGLQPLSILGVDGDPGDPETTQPATAALAAAGDGSVAENDTLDKARAVRDAKNDAITRGGPNVPVIFDIGELSEADAKDAISKASVATTLDKQEASEKSHRSRRRVLAAIVDRRAGLG